jgi:hypothetical protein
MRTKQSDIFGKALGNTLEKGGTKAGAERGWETRRGRSPVEEPKGEAKLHPTWQKMADYHAREVVNIEQKIEELARAGKDTSKLRVQSLIHSAAYKAAKASKNPTEEDIVADMTEGQKKVYNEHFAQEREPGERPQPPKKEPEKPKDEKPKEPEKPKPLTAWDVKAEGNHIASKLRGLKVKLRSGHSVGPIKVSSVTEEGDGIFIEMFAEDLKIGGEDDDDSNDGAAEDKLLTDGQKIVQEKFPNHDVHPVSSEKGYFGFSITPKKAEKSAAEVVGGMIGGFLAKEGTPSGAKRGWETRRGRAPVEKPKTERPKAQPVLSSLGSGKASPETIGQMREGLKTLANVFSREGYEAQRDAVVRLLTHGLEATPNTETKMSQEERIKEARGLLGYGMKAAQEAISQSQDGNPPPWFDDIKDAVEAYDEEQAKPPSNSMRDLKLRGVAQEGNVHVKIVPLSSGEGYGVETTVDGDRRYPREPGMSLEEAQQFALGQLKNPRQTQSLVGPPKPEEKPKAPKIPEGRPYKNVGDLAAE